MIRFTPSVGKALAVAAAAFLMLPSMASAIDMTIVSSSVPDGGTLFPGETVTFDLAMTPDTSGTSLFGIGATVSGYDLPDITSSRQFGLAFADATVVTTAFVQGCPPTFGCVNGLDNSTDGEERYDVNLLNPQAYTTDLFQGVNTSPAQGDGTADEGIGGGLVSGGDVHFRVTFIAVPESSVVNTFTMNFNVDAIRSMGVVESSSTPFTLTVIPEPGTALLMGLGLAGLASSRRR